MPMRTMSVKDWIAVPDNPIQRDTERHAAKAKHLLTPLPIHRIVYAAELPTGKLVKLDGHTRALLWKRNQVRPPHTVEVNIIGVDSMGEAMALYQTLDSKEALETVSDKVTGAFGEQHFKPQSGLLQRGGVSTSLRTCWSILHGFSISSSQQVRDEKRTGFDIYSAVREFGSELYALDSFQLKTGDASSGIVVAFILTYRRYGMKVVPFWRSVWGKGGTKLDGKMDGVQALCELMAARKGRAQGSSAAWDIAARAVMAVEKWLADQDLQITPRPYDLTGYIKNMKPQERLIKTEHSTNGDRAEV